MESSKNPSKSLKNPSKIHEIVQESFKIPQESFKNHTKVGMELTRSFERGEVYNLSSGKFRSSLQLYISFHYYFWAHFTIKGSCPIKSTSNFRIRCQMELVVFYCHQWLLAKVREEINCHQFNLYQHCDQAVLLSSISQSYYYNVWVK